MQSAQAVVSFGFDPALCCKHVSNPTIVVLVGGWREAKATVTRSQVNQTESMVDELVNYKMLMI